MSVVIEYRIQNTEYRIQVEMKNQKLKIKSAFKHIRLKFKNSNHPAKALRGKGAFGTLD